MVDALDGGRGRPHAVGVHRLARVGLQPHRTETFKLSREPQFVAKVSDVVELYLNPPERAVVLCVDEKCQIQALDRTAAYPAVAAGLPERATHDYKRHGTSTLFAALDVSNGQVIGTLHSRHRAIEFHSPTNASIARRRPSSTSTSSSTTAHTHKTPTIRKWLNAHPASCCTSPTSSSWLNLVERCSPRYQQETPPRRTPLLRSRTPHQSVDEDLDDDPDPRWTKTANQILEPSPASKLPASLTGGRLKAR